MRYAFALWMSICSWLLCCGNVCAQHESNGVRTLHYRPAGDGSFVLVKGKRRFNRALYGTHTAFAAESLLHKHAPEFVRVDINHKRIDLSSFRGKVVMINFWATWCAPCQLEMPRFVSWQSRYGSRGLQIIGISMDDDPARGRKLVAMRSGNYPVAMGDGKI